MASQTFDQLINKAIKDWEAPDLMNAAHAPRGKKIPFSSPLMNWATYGGIPRNRITEFFGTPGAGKSTSAIDICKNAYQIFAEEYEEEMQKLRELAQKEPKKYRGPLDDLQERGIKKVLYIDLENSFDSEWSKTLGIQEDQIHIMTPPDRAAEEELQLLHELIETGEVGLVVLDSIPSLVTKAELEKKYGERTVSALAGLLTIFFRKIVPILTRYECTLLTINQIRDNMENPYVTQTPGGQAPKFYASLRIEFKLGVPVDFLGNELPQKAENPAGYKVTGKIVKQKSAPFDRKVGSYFLMVSKGIMPVFDYVNLAINSYSLILKSGGWFRVCDPVSGEILEVDGKELKIQGLAGVYEYVQTNKEYYESLKEFIEADINGREPDFSRQLGLEEPTEDEIDDDPSVEETTSEGE